MTTFLLVCILLALVIGAVWLQNLALGILAIVGAIAAVIYFDIDLLTVLGIGVASLLVLYAIVTIFFPEQWAAADTSGKEMDAVRQLPEEVGVAIAADTYSTDRLLDARQRLLRAGMPKGSIYIEKLDQEISDRQKSSGGA